MPDVRSWGRRGPGRAKVALLGPRLAAAGPPAVAYPLSLPVRRACSTSQLISGSSIRVRDVPFASISAASSPVSCTINWLSGGEPPRARSNDGGMYKSVILVPN